MKRVIKASIKNADKLTQIEGPRYDPNWQKQRIQEIADYLDPYGIDVEVDEVTEDRVAFTVYQPQYPEAGEGYYAALPNYDVIHRLKSRAGRSESWGLGREDIFVSAMSDRFDKCLADTSEYLSLAQQQVDIVMDSLNRKYNMDSNIQVDRLSLWYASRPELVMYFDKSSFISLDGFEYKLDSYIRIGDYKSAYDFMKDMTPSGFLHIFTPELVKAALGDTVLRDIEFGFLGKTDIVADAVDILNDKFSRSKYDVIARADGSIVDCEFIYEGESYTFDMENYFQAIFDIWFNDSNRNYEGAIDYAVKNLYKRITAKCRRIITQHKKSLERVDQEARDSAML